MGINTSVMIDTVGIPCRSKVIPSCKLPDEQAPQSPIPAITMSALLWRSARISGFGGRLDECFFA